MSFETFESYFFTSASTTVIGIIHPSSSSPSSAMTPPSSLEQARAGRIWEECVGGCYYMYARTLMPPCII
jgi:hypothetical protein